VCAIRHTPEAEALLRPELRHSAHVGAIRSHRAYAIESHGNPRWKRLNLLHEKGRMLTEISFSHASGGDTGVQIPHELRDLGVVFHPARMVMRSRMRRCSSSRSFWDRIS